VGVCGSLSRKDRVQRRERQHMRRREKGSCDENGEDKCNQGIES